jgi:RND family efflux transporter MFP subunit
MAGGCERPTAGLTAANGPSGTAPAATKVEVVRPGRATVRRVVEEPGQVEAAEVTPIHAKLSGYARVVSVDIGDRIKKGQALAELWVPEVEADAAQKRAGLDEAKARRVQASSSVALAQAGLVTAEAKVAEARAEVRRAEAENVRRRSEFERVRQLVGERAATGSLMDESRNAMGASEASREAAGAAVGSAEAALGEARALVEKARADATAADAGLEVAGAEARRAEAMLGYARVEAPYDGVVTRRNIDSGHLTVAGPQGEPLFVVARVDVVTVVVGVPEASAAAVGPGDAASIRLQALGGRTIEGKVSRTAYSLDPATRTLRVEVDLPNADGILRPGLYAYAAIAAEEHRDALTVPLTALIRDGTKTVCVCVEGSRAVRRPVQLGLVDGARAEILSGLVSDEVVVRANPATLVEGQPVVPIAVAETPAGPKP